MSWNEKWGFEKLGIGIISVTSVLVLFLGVFVYASLMSGNPYAMPTNARNEPERAPAAAILPALEPSSRVTAVVSTGKDAEVVDLICFNGSSPVTIKSEAKQVRLRGRICGGETIEQPEIVNRTNGFIATVFETSPRRLSSDYIHLADGPNQIWISYTDAAGARRMTELTISKTVKR